jgi:hypothetical protein
VPNQTKITPVVRQPAASSSIEVTSLFMTAAGAREFAAKAREIRDSYDITSATHWNAWNAVACAADAAAEELGG